jgi:putative hydrolase of the HAD superfamily
MSPVATVISDLGQVILWFDNKIFFRKMTAFCSRSVDEIREVVHLNTEFVTLFDLGKLTPQEFYERAVARIGAHVGFENFIAAYVDVFTLNRPVFELLKSFKGKYRLVLLSNTDVSRFGSVKKKFPEIFIFDDYVLSFEFGAMKPDPAIYKEALRKAGGSASSCIFIDDMEENVKAAAALGINSLLYKPDTDLEQELRALGVS